MDLLRLVLFGGLVGHKLFWEYMRLRDPRPQPAKRLTLPWKKRLVKHGKAAVLVLLLVQTLFLNVLPIAPEPGLLRWAGLLFFALGLGVAIAGRYQLGRSWANIEDEQHRHGQQLVHHGIYRYIRHPIYAGDVLLLIGLELALNSWLVLAVLVPLLISIRQALAEETVLVQVVEGYADYRKRTKRFIPFVV
jgi:protein-S-isoprenylcysteine O-methyltransferase Ste14